MLECKIELTGVTTEELIYALDEAKRLIEAGNISGADSREDETGSYSFEVDGEESNSIECSCNHTNYYEDGEVQITCSDCQATITVL